MADALRALIRFYTTGDNEDRVAYDIAWVHDKASPVDTINGFVEVYMDPAGMKGAWEALVFYVNPEKTEGIRELAAAAQWFEDRMPWAAQYRKEGVRGITANAIDVVVESGDSGPITPVGHQPAERSGHPREVRQQVCLADQRQRGLRQIDFLRVSQEFAWSVEEAERAENGAALPAS
jgi:dipeptidyl-peptidase-3